MAWNRPIGLFVLLLSLLALAACGQSVAPVADNPQLAGAAPADNSGALPSIWDLDKVPGGGGHSVSSTSQQTRHGSEYLDNLVHHGTVQGTDLFLDSGQGEGNDHYAWGVYRFEGLLGKHPQNLNVVASPGGLDQHYYVGIANYTSGNWDFFGPTSLPEFQIDLHENYSRYVTALGNMYILVICTNGATLTHHYSTLTYTEGGDGLPGMPHGLSATDGTYGDKTVVTWEAGEGATSYEVYRKRDGSNDDFAKVGEVTTTEFDDTTGDAGIRYIYKARSKNEHGTSAFSNTDSGYRGALQDPCPTGVAASDGTYGDHVHISWNGVAGTIYHVSRLKPGENAWTALGNSDGLSYDDTTGDAGQSYYYKIQPDGHDCYGADSGYRSGSPDPCPSQVAASDGTYSDHVLVSWTGVAGSTYKIYRTPQNNGGDWTLIATTTDLHASDTSGDPGTVYYYKVTLDGHDCYGADSGYRSSQQQQDGCPSNESASDGTYTDHVHITWTGVVGDSYKVYRIPSGGNDLTLIGTTTNLEFNDTGADHGVTYYYKVVLDGHDCYSADSGYLAALPDACPTQAAASDGTYTDHVLVSWSGVAGSTYKVYRTPQNNGGEWTLIATTTDLHTSDTSGEPGTVYYYKVQLDGHDCYTADSGYRAAQPDACPSQAAASDGTFTDHVHVSWSGVNGSTYNIYRHPQNGGDWSLLGSVTNLEYNDTSGEAGTVYYYKVVLDGHDCYTADSGYKAAQ